MQILAAAAAAAHNRAARAAATSVKSILSTTDLGSGPLSLPSAVKHKPPTTCTFQRRLPRRPRESEDKRFRCPFCELAYYHKKHLKYHLTKKHGFWLFATVSWNVLLALTACVLLIKVIYLNLNVVVQSFWRTRHVADFPALY